MVTETFPIIVKSLSNLEEPLASELKSLGINVRQKGHRVVYCDGTLTDVYRINMFSRLAGKVLVELSRGRAHTTDAVYKHTCQIDWPDLFSVNKTIAVDALVHQNRQFKNSMYAAQLVKDGIVDTFRKKLNKRPSVDPRNADIIINVHIDRQKLTLSLDSSGEPLHKRGYRQDSGKAPLNEILAAGLLTLCGWNGKTNVIDPMCGSGTIVIEAALIASHIAPGLIRSDYAFKKWRSFNQETYEKLITEAQKAVCSVPITICGSDIDKRYIKMARKNALTAGVDALVSFKTADFFETTPPPPPGLVIMNPPYGERLPLDDRVAFNKQLGDRFKAVYTGYQAALITGDLKAVKQLGLRTSSRTTLYNGPIESRLLTYDLYEGSRKKKYQSD